MRAPRTLVGTLGALVTGGGRKVQRKVLGPAAGAGGSGSGSSSATTRKVRIVKKAPARGVSAPQPPARLPRRGATATAVRGRGSRDGAGAGAGAGSGGAGTGAGGTRFTGRAAANARSSAAAAAAATAAMRPGAGSTPHGVASQAQRDRIAAVLAARRRSGASAGASSASSARSASGSGGAYSGVLGGVVAARAGRQTAEVRRAVSKVLQARTRLEAAGGGTQGARAGQGRRPGPPPAPAGAPRKRRGPGSVAGGAGASQPSVKRQRVGTGGAAAASTAAAGSMGPPKQQPQQPPLPQRQPPQRQQQQQQRRPRMQRTPAPTLPKPMPRPQKRPSARSLPSRPGMATPLHAPAEDMRSEIGRLNMLLFADVCQWRPLLGAAAAKAALPPDLQLATVPLKFRSPQQCVGLCCCWVSWSVPVCPWH